MFAGLMQSPAFRIGHIPILGISQARRCPNRSDALLYSSWNNGGSGRGLRSVVEEELFDAMSRLGLRATAKSKRLGLKQIEIPRRYHAKLQGLALPLTALCCAHKQQDSIPGAHHQVKDLEAIDSQRQWLWQPRNGGPLARACYFLPGDSGAR